MERNVPIAQFANRKTLILGGSRGIGAALVRKFAGEGSQVAFTYAGSHDAAAALAAETGAKAIRADSADRDALMAVVAAEGPIDVLLINAGMLVLGDPLTLDPAEIDRMIDINTRAPYFASVGAARAMPDGGRILIIGSSTADRLPFPGASAYAMTKAALQGMVRGLARDFGPHGITINLIQPGPTDTEMNPADGPMGDFMRNFTAIGRHVRTWEIADYAAFLASQPAAMVTGTIHTTDGGFGA